jgi:hypothetical protein
MPEPGLNWKIGGEVSAQEVPNRMVKHDILPQRNVAIKVMIEGDPEEEVQVRKDAPIAEILGAVFLAKPVADDTVFNLVEKPERLSEGAAVKFGRTSRGYKSQSRRSQEECHHGRCSKQPR